MTQGTSMAMMISAFPDTERGKVLGLQLSVVGAGGIAGPAIGGLIVSEFGWRGVFFSTALLGFLAVIAAQAILDGRRVHRGSESTSFDWPGAALSASTLVTLMLAISTGPKVGWESPAIMAGLFSVVLLAGAFVWWELRTTAPMFDVRLFRRTLFFTGVSASFLSFVGRSAFHFLMDVTSIVV